MPPYSTAAAPEQAEKLFDFLPNVFTTFKQGTDQAALCSSHSCCSQSTHSLRAHCCLHSSGFTPTGGPPRPGLPPARPAPRRGGGRSSSSESSLRFISEAKKKKRIRKGTHHAINVIIILVVFVVFIVVFILTFREHVVFERLACEIVDSTRYDLHSSEEDKMHAKGHRGPDGTHFLLDVLADLIIHFQFLLKVVELFFANLTCLNVLFAGGNRR